MASVLPAAVLLADPHGGAARLGITRTLMMCGTSCPARFRPLSSAPSSGAAAGAKVFVGTPDQHPGRHLGLFIIGGDLAAAAWADRGERTRLSLFLVSAPPSRACS